MTTAAAAGHTPGPRISGGPYINGIPLHSIPPGTWLVYAKNDVQIGTLTYTSNENLRGWRFFPADQGLPSRKCWPVARRAIPRRFGHADSLVAVDPAIAAIARATEPQQ